MELWINTFVMMFAAFSIVMSFVMHTKNFMSAILFKVVPFFGGLLILVQSAMIAGILNVQ